MKHMKAFMAGITFPSIFLPIFLSLAWVIGRKEMFTIPFLHFIPLIWGIWNILYFAVFKKFLPKDKNTRLLLTGALLGLLVALYGVFCVDIPSLIGLQGSLKYVPLIIGPLIYAILWLFVMKPLNDLLHLPD